LDYTQQHPPTAGAAAMFSRLCIAAVALVLTTAVACADPVLVNRPGLPLRPEPVEARLIDGSKLFLALNERQIEIATPYGKLQIKLTEIQRIEFGTRVAPDVARKIDAAVSTLESSDEKKAEAWAALAEAKEFAYPTLL